MLIFSRRIKKYVNLWIVVKSKNTTDIKTEIGHRVDKEREHSQIDEEGSVVKGDLIIKQLMRTELRP